MIILYIIISYLVMLGMIIGKYDNSKDVETEAWFMLVFSPIILPIILGMNYYESNKNKN